VQAGENRSHQSPLCAASTQSILAKAFRGELVATEAELGRREGHEYEPASALLERIRKERESHASSKPERKRTRTKATGTLPRKSRAYRGKIADDHAQRLAGVLLWGCTPPSIPVREFVLESAQRKFFLTMLD
jgi:hypothetical protein